MMKNKFIIRCVAAVMEVLVIFALGFTVGRLTVQNENVKIQQEEETVTGGGAEEGENGADIAKLLPLKNELEAKCNELQGNWAIYIEDLVGGESFSINNEKMVSASLIKLFVMGSVYQEIENGTINRDEVLEDLKMMIEVSDNQATNRLVAKLGGGKYTDMNNEVFKNGLNKINSFAVELGCYDTEQQRDLMSSRPQPIPEENYTSVEDCGKILSMIYNKKLVSENASDEMYEFLCNQKRRNKIPSGLPDDCKCANKTGELSNVENDVAIIVPPSGAYVLCVMSNNIDSPQMAQKTISELSKNVYEFYIQNGIAATDNKEG